MACTLSGLMPGRVAAANCGKKDDLLSQRCSDLPYSQKAAVTN